MKAVSPSLKALAFCVAALALFACIAAFIPDFSGPATPRGFVSLRGETITLEGAGLYRDDSVSFASQAKAQDIVTLAFGVPLAIVSGVLLAKNSALGYLLSGLFLIKGLTLALAIGSMILRAAFTGLPINPAETIVFTIIIAFGVLISILYIKAIH